MTDTREVPALIHHANIRYLRIGVGSEISCMLQPRLCWVTNIRTLWTHLVFEYGGNFTIANEALELYRANDDRSDIAYKFWVTLYPLVGASMRQVALEGSTLATSAGVTPGKVRFLWADAIASALYGEHHRS